MRKIFLFALITVSTVLVNSCAVNSESKNLTNGKIKLKTINNKNFKLKHPKSWIKFGAVGYFYLAPKKFKKENPEDELNNIKVNNNIIYVDKFEGIEETLHSHCNTLRRGEKSKDYKVIKTKEDSKYLFKIESTIKYVGIKEKYKRVEYFYTINKKLDYVQFQMRESLFEIYIDEAMIIINSFEPKK